MGRTIGIQHRVKRTAADEARPTIVYILDGGHGRRIELATEDDELDFVRGRHPVHYRGVNPEDQLSSTRFPIRHVRWRKMKAGEEVSAIPESYQRWEGRTVYVATHVPDQYDGLSAGDRVAMLLGGSGDRLAYALSRFGESIGATVHRLPPFVFKAERGDGPREDDAQLLATLLLNDIAGRFHRVTPRDRDIIAVSEAYRARRFTQQDRIACDQRVRQQAIGEAFVCRDGGYPEGTIEETYDRLRASSAINTDLTREEARREAELKTAVHDIPIWRGYFEGICGCGEVVAGGLITAIQDIRRFVVQPDPVTMQRLHQERDALLVSASFADDLQNVADRVTPAMPLFQQVQIVRSWQREQGKEDEAVQLDQAIEIMRQAHRLRRDAQCKTINRLVAFCGVHVRQGGKYADVPPSKSFPRKRGGEVTNHNPLARQALYQLGEQFNRRPDSTWGQRLRENKARLMAIHPEPEPGPNGKKRWTKGHIHKTAIWRTLTQFTREMGREWLRIDRQNGHSTPVAEKEQAGVTE